MSKKQVTKSVPRISVANPRRHLTKEDIGKIPLKKRIAMLDEVAPFLVKPPRLRKLIHISVQKAHGKKIADALDALFESVDNVYDLEQQSGAHNPSLVERQRSGAIRRELNEAVEKLSTQWKELYMLA